MSHSQISPAILYWGTPVVLITTKNDDNTSNIGPMSSAFWLGDRCILGIARHSKTAQNLLHTKQCVLNLPSDDMTGAVNALARTTGTETVPPQKIKLGYRYVKDKFSEAKVSPEASEVVDCPRIRECPVQMEAEMQGYNDTLGGFVLVIEVRIVRTYVVDSIRLDGYPNRVNADAWRPMIMSFQHLYGLRGREENSHLAEIDEELYRLSKGPPRGTVVPASGPMEGAGKGMGEV